MTPRRPSWLWRGRIPAGELTLCVGRGGLGKTVAVGASLTAQVSRGALDGDLTGAGSVLIASAEDSIEHTLTPRLAAAGADMSRVGFITTPLDLPEACDDLAAAIRESSVRLLILDPLNAFLGFGIDSHNDKDLRVALGPLAELAHDTGCSVVAIGHVNKLRTGDAYALVSGSVAYFNGPRSVLIVAPDPEAEEDDDTARVLVHGKSNLGELAPPIRFRVASAEVDTADGPAGVPVIEWGAEVAHLSSSDALAGLDADERTATDDAGEWLADQLADGPRVGRDVKADAKRAGYPSRTVQRAAKRLGVVPRLIGFGEPAEWSLPGSRALYTNGGATGPVDAVTASETADEASSISRADPPDATGATVHGNGRAARLDRDGCTGCGCTGCGPLPDGRCLACALAVTP